MGFHLFHRWHYKIPNQARICVTCKKKQSRVYTWQSWQTDDDFFQWNMEIGCIKRNLQLKTLLEEFQEQQRKEEEELIDSVIKNKVKK